MLLTDRWLIICCFQVAHPDIRDQLVGYIYNGFLVPVLAPALHKVVIALSPPVKPPSNDLWTSIQRTEFRKKLEFRTQLIVLNEMKFVHYLKFSLFNL